MGVCLTKGRHCPERHSPWIVSPSERFSGVPAVKFGSGTGANTHGKSAYNRRFLQTGRFCQEITGQYRRERKCAKNSQSAPRGKKQGRPELRYDRNFHPDHGGWNPAGSGRAGKPGDRLVTARYCLFAVVPRAGRSPRYPRNPSWTAGSVPSGPEKILTLLPARGIPLTRRLHEDRLFLLQRRYPRRIRER